MHRAFGVISKRLLQVRPGEGRKVLLTFLYFCLIITAYYVVKPVSRSLVLGGLGSQLVPFGDLVSAIMMGPMVALFARLVDRVEKRRLVSWTFWTTAASLALFWVLLRYPSRWVSAALYVWVAIFSVLVVTLFWLVANDLYHPREAKRLFGFIGSGGILGGVLGSSIAAIGAKLIGTEQLLLFSAGILLVCWAVVGRLWRFAVEPSGSEAVSSAPRDVKLHNLGSVMQRLAGSRYLLLLVGLVGIGKIVSTLIYYQFNPFIEHMFASQDAKTAFLGLYLGWVNVASFVIQFFFTSWILRRLGLTSALLILPVGLLCGSIGMLAMPMFWIAASNELYDGSLNYSLQQTSKEVLYLPIDRSIRYKIKPFIDMIVFRFGKGVAAVIGIVVLNVLHLQAQVLSLLTVPLTVAWIVLAIQLRRDYVKTIRGVLEARAAARRTPETSKAAANGAQPGVLERWLESLAVRHDVGTKLSLASQLLLSQGAMAQDAKALLDALADYEDGFYDLGSLAADIPRDRLIECLSDRREPMAIRRAAIRRLTNQDGQDSVDALLGLLGVEDDATVRHELIRGLTLLRVRHLRTLEFAQRLVRREIGKEVKVYQRILHVGTLYHQVAQDDPAWPRSDDDPALQLLRLLLDETLQQIFQLLSLICRPEDIYLVFTQLHEPEAFARADAIELLDNLLDPALRWLIFPVLDENRFLDRIDGTEHERSADSPEAFRTLQQGIWDHNCWLSVVILCLVGRLRLEPILRELDQLDEDQESLVGLGAKVARYLANLSASE